VVEELRRALEDIERTRDLLLRQGPQPGAESEKLSPSNGGEPERVLAEIPVAIVTTDADGVVLFANSAARAAYEGVAQELVGKPFASLLDAEDRAAFAKECRALVEVGATVQHPVRLTAAAGQRPRSAVLWGSLARFGVDPELVWTIQPDGSVRADGSFDQVPRALVTLASLPALCAGPEELLTRASEVCQRGLGEEHSLSLMLGSPRTPEVVASTSQLGQAVDGAQILTDEGPCLAAHDVGDVVVSDDLRHDPRWPRLRERVASMAVGGVVAVPVMRAEERVGAFNVFTQPGTPPSDELVDKAELLASALAAALEEVTTRAQLRSEADGMRAALESRAVIDQAKGIIMADKRCTPEEAFAHLADLSSRSHVKIRDVAAALVDITVSGR
jgi:PAS domain-containing protein